jgi:hypothetical protein
LPPGQEFNILMTLIGLGMLIWFYRKARHATQESPTDTASATAVATDTQHGLWVKRLVFILLLILPTIIPSDWTQDVAKRYGARHPGMTQSAIYPEVQN